MGKYLKTLCEIVWLDAESSHGWEQDEEVDAEQVPIITIGFLIKRNEHTVVIATSIDQETGQCSNSRIKIPVGMIQSIKLLGGPRKSKEKPIPRQEMPQANV